MKTWEDQISLFPNSDNVRPTVGIARDYVGEHLQGRFSGIEYEEKLDSDPYPLPATSAREGYYGDLHLNYWLSGIKDSNSILQHYRRKLGQSPSNYLDFGGASGRVARHMKFQHDIPDVWIADINREHVNFVLDTFEGTIKAFQSHSVPHLPIEDNSLDFISAFSVFSHIESFDETWLLELRRILKPNGVLILTANIDTFQDITSGWPVYKALVNHPSFDTNQLGSPLSTPRHVVRWNANGSYSSVVYLRSDYAEKRWAPLFSSMEIHPYLTQYQTGVVFQK